jgi:regulator of sigma E protease
MEFLIKAAQLILSLSILVVLHELGHFIPARLFKTRVEKFYLFFDPWFSLVKKKIGGTEFGIGWIPFGGYVKISGMVDESMDKEQMSKPAQPWEFRAKPAWQRLIIMVGGVTVNLLLGLFLYVWGNDYLPLQEVRYGVHPSEVMKEQGLQDGDRIIGVGALTPRTLEEVTKAVLIDGYRDLVIERNGQRQVVTLERNVHDKILDSGERGLFAPRIPFVIDTVLKGPAQKAGLMKGDSIVSVDGASTPWFVDFREKMASKKGEEVLIGVYRNGAPMELPVKVTEEGTIGIGNRSPKDFFRLEHERYSFVESIPAGIDYGINTLKSYVGSLKLLFSKSGAGQIGGFGAIGNLFSATWNWQQFWNMTAFLSIVLAFMNILPIPALDGGHVMFLLYEMIFRRPPNQRVLEVAQMVGMALLFGLILYANGNDIFKWVTGRM